MEVSTKQRRRAAAMRRRMHNVILAAVFLLIIIVFILINLCTKDKTFSETENRNLAQKPGFSVQALADGTFTSGVDNYCNDQFFGRDKWISIKMKAESLLGRKESGGVYLCSNGYLMAEPDPVDETATANTLDAINRFHDAHPELPTTVMVAPSAAVVLTDYLPKNAPVMDQLGYLDAFRQKLGAGISYVNLANPLIAHKDEYIYYKTDHHWTSLGAYYAFQAAQGSLRIENPIADYNIYTVTDSFQGTLTSKSGSYASVDSIDVYEPLGTNVRYYVNYVADGEKICSLYKSECLEDKDKYTVFFGGNHPLVEIQTTANNDRSLLVFKDSYANCFMQFLVPYYEKIIMIDPRYYYDNVEAVLTGYGITDVLYLYSADTIFTDKSLVDVLLSGLEESAAEAEPEWGAAMGEGEPEESAVESSVADSAVDDAEASTAEAGSDVPEDAAASSAEVA